MHEEKKMSLIRNGPDNLFVFAFFHLQNLIANLC